MKKLIFLLLPFLFFSCGYKVAGTGGGHLPAGLKSVEVFFFENRTGFSRVQSILKGELSSELSRKGFTSSDKVLDGTLGGEITNISVTTASKESSDSAFERRVTMVVNVHIKKMDGTVVFSRKGISENYVYKASSGNSSGFGVPTSALESLCEKMSKRIVLLAGSDF